MLGKAPPLVVKNDEYESWDKLITEPLRPHLRYLYDAFIPFSHKVRGLVKSACFVVHLRENSKFKQGQKFLWLNFSKCHLF
jgi:hypothetical protein